MKTTNNIQKGIIPRKLHTLISSAKRIGPIELLIILLIPMLMADLLSRYTMKLWKLGFAEYTKIFVCLPLVMFIISIIVFLSRGKTWVKIAMIFAFVSLISFTTDKIFLYKVDFIELTINDIPSREIMKPINKKYQNRLSWSSASRRNCRIYFPRQVFDKKNIIETIRNNGLQNIKQ